MEEHELKRCAKCGEWKPRTSEFFTKKSNQADGLFSWCKTCKNNRPMRDYKREYKARHTRMLLDPAFAKHVRDLQRKSEEKRRAEGFRRVRKRSTVVKGLPIKEYRKLYRETHREERLAYKRQRRASKKFFDLMALTGEIK